ncbi:hypothetical protein BJY04DRAFT_231952 [Aspergillus karnatakaensis]|uniref:uncharacterized protein n=1 Tax=Aspergillus karnatakaensis TaxID=1810916 RepID=UPI003CCD2F1D
MTEVMEPANGNEVGKAEKEGKSEQDADSPGKRISRVDQYRTYTWRLKKTSKPDKQKRAKGAVLIVRRTIDYKGRYDKTEIEIRSPFLVTVLQELNPETESLAQETPPSASPVLFYHSRFGLQAAFEAEKAKQQPNEDAIKDLSVALEYLKQDHEKTVASMDALLSKQEIKWDLFWALFVPNSLVYHYHQLTQQDQILRFRRLQKRYERDRDCLSWHILCDIITIDGAKLGFAKAPDFEIDEFPGARKIYDLTVFPLQFVKNQSSIYQHAVERGKRYCEIRDKACMDARARRCARYSTKTWTLNSSAFHLNKSFGRAMLDAKAFKTFEPNATYYRTVYRQLKSGIPTKDDDFAICNPVIVGFSFGTKLWGGLGMDYCRPITWGHEAFNSLVLEANKKKLIHALVTQHTAKTDHFDDVIAGKGKGLIGLLSGGPGCGKTLTAEAVSEETRRPLYSVSAGELGTNPADVDSRLTLVLDLSQRWNAILLLDEADVFLQARNTTDVARRIHFSFSYPDLDFTSRKTIWKTFLTRHSNATKGQGKSTALCFDDSQIEELATPALNGRQVKNLVSCARSLALDGGETMTMSHLRSALAVTSDWSLAVQEAVPVNKAP